MNSRDFFNQGSSFMFEGGEPVGPGGMDCLQLRHQPAGPFHYLISEQAKSLVALQELQHEVGALLEFRDLVMDTFPNLRTKLAASTPSTMTSHHHHHHNHHQHTASNIPVSIRPTDWTPGIRVRKKITNKDETRGSSKKNDSTTVQDSGFSTETSSKETHSASSTAPPPSSAAGAADDVEDELWHLLELIHRKGTRLKDEAEALQGTLRHGGGSLVRSESRDGGFQRTLFHSSSADDVRQLRRERDLLLDRLAEMEAEVLAGRVHTSRLQEDLENLMTTKHDLEEQLKAVVTQRGEVNSRIHDLHLQFVTKSASGSPETSNNNSSNGGSTSEKIKYFVDRNKEIATTSSAAASAILSSTLSSSAAVLSSPVTSTTAAGQRTSTQYHHHSARKSVSDLDVVLGDNLPKCKVPDTKKITAILKERDPLVLQKHLLTTTVQNQVLQEQLDSAVNLEIGLRDKLNKFRDENDDLRFQLEDRNIELEGTRARVRVLEDLHQPSVAPKSTASPDVIPASDAGAVTPDHLRRRLSRSEITTASMKAMGPLPLNLQMDHSSSTESAQDQTERERRESTSSAKRRPSKIPLKSYTAPKPPGGKHSPAPRSRSGDSPGRPHSAQSWRNNRGGGEGNSLGGSKGSSSGGSLPKSRNGSLVTARDSLSTKLRGSDSVSPGSLGRGCSSKKGTAQNAKETTINTAANGAIHHGDKVRSKTTSSIWNFFRRDN